MATVSDSDGRPTPIDDDCDKPNLGYGLSGKIFGLSAMESAAGYSEMMALPNEIGRQQMFFLFFVAGFRVISPRYFQAAFRREAHG